MNLSPEELRARILGACRGNRPKVVEASVDYLIKMIHKLENEKIGLMVIMNEMKEERDDEIHSNNSK